MDNLEKRHKHHIQPRHLGGSNDPSNIELIDPVLHAELHALRFIEGEDRWFCSMHEGWPHLDSRLQDEVRKALSERNVAKRPEVGAKISAALKGRPARNKGVPRTEEERKKISQGQIGLKKSEETKAKIAASKRGQKHSEETKAKIAASVSTAKRRSK